MLCPQCQNTMREREKGDVVIDVCPACRGVWLEAGELEKLVASEQRYYDRDDDDDDRRWSDSRGRVEQYGPPGKSDGRPSQQQPKKKSSFLSNIFESFGGEGGD